MSSSQELEWRLRAFINAPENFLDSIGFVNAIHSFPVFASQTPYAIEVEGQVVTPVFTNKSDLEIFKQEQESAKNQEWTERTCLEVLEEVIVKGISGIIFNIKKDGDFGNSTIFKSSEFIEFLNYFTNILNQVMGEKNLDADTLDKYYFVPVFIHPKQEGGYDRLYPTMSTPDHKSYVPVFSSPKSLARWYNHEEFGGPFREAVGSILAWTPNEIYQTDDGDNNIDDTVGIVVNPFDQDQILINWSDIEE